MEPDSGIAATLEDAVRAFARIDRHRSFETARSRLADAQFDFIVTNLRLAAFNGLHLVYLARSTTRAVPAVVYTERREAPLAREVQRAGAFYDIVERLPVTLAACLSNALPPRDRRDPAVPDRRHAFRGGRRSWDEHLLLRFA